MTTVIEDSELSSELQELYLKTKHWISDVEFVENELRFLKLLFSKKFPQVFKSADFEDIAELLKKIDKIDTTLPKLKSNILVYMNTLESLIVEVKQNMDVSLIENHTKLEFELNGVLQAFQNLKGMVFFLTKHTSESDVFASKAL